MPTRPRGARKRRATCVICEIEYNDGYPVFFSCMIKHIFAIVFLLVLSASIPFAAIFAIAPTPTPVEYILPYPGILPTHPLYFLKKFRDSLIETMITSPVKKAEFYILQADKKLNMAIFLFEQKKDVEATRQLTESTGLREKAVVQLETLNIDAAKAPRFVVEKLTGSIQKHIEVVTGLKRGVDVLQTLLARSQKLFRTDVYKSDQ